MFWDNVAGVYDIFVKVINRKCHIALCEIIEERISPSDNILECACGTGMITKHVAPKCRQITATDFSAKMLQKAAKNCAAYGNVCFKTADITHLDMPAASFDKVIAANVIHLLDDPKAALESLARVCRPGGELIIPTYVNKEKNGRDNAFSRVVGRAGADFKKQFSFDTYKAFFKEAGYTDVEFKLAGGRMPCAVAFVHVGKRPINGRAEQ